MTELQAKAIKRIKDVYAKAEDIYGIPLAFPIVSFRLKGRRAGYVVVILNKLALNNDLLHDHGEDFINDTPGHEAAHLISYAVYGYNIEPHGQEWKKVMIKVCGQQPTRCHLLEVKTNHIYSCNCNKPIYLSTTRHNKYLTGQRFYCKTCKAEIKWNKLHENKTTQLFRTV